MAGKLGRLEGFYARILEGIAVAMMASLVGVIAWSVFGRQVLRISVPWTEEVGAGLLLWMVALGAAAVWYRRGHIAIDVVLRRMGLRSRHITLLAIELGSLLLFTVIFIGAVLMMFASANNSTAALGISYTYIYLGLVIGLGSMVLFSLAHLVRLLAGGPSGVQALQGGDEWNTLSSS